MSDEPVKSDQVIEKDFLVGSIEQGKQLLDVFNNLEKGIKSLAIESTKYFGISIRTLADLEKRKEALDTVVKLEKANTEVAKQKAIVEAALQKMEQEKLKTEQQVEKLEQQRAKTDAANLTLQQKLKKEAQNVNKERENEIKNLKATNSLHEQQKKQLKAVSDRYKELVARGRESTVTGRLLKAEFDRLDTSVRKAEESVGQFGRSVGNYSRFAKDAFEETGLFNTGIGKLVSGLGELKKKLEENAEQGGKFSTQMKIGVAGAITLAIVALKELAEINSSVKEGFEKIGAQLGGFVTGGFAGAKAAGAFKDALFESFVTLREFGLELQKVSLDEGDFLDISNDTTIGFKERNAALQEAIRLGKERAKITVDSAKVELDVINKQVEAASIGLRKADPELLDKQAEAQKKLNEALDSEQDLLRENAQAERKLAEERTTAAIDLLLKTKQSANARKVILEKELADEKVQLEQRKKDADELLSVNNATTKKQVDIFKEGFKVEFDSQSILNEQDAIALKNKIESIQFLDENNKMVGIGVEAQKTLAEIVAKYQKENIDYLETKKKLQEEEIKRAQKLSQIDAEIGIMKQTDDVKALSEAYEVLDRKIEENFEKILNSPFNNKLLKQRQLQLKQQKQNADDLYDEQSKLLIKQADLEKQKVKDTVSDEKVKAAEIKKINEQLQIDLGNLQAKTLAETIANNERTTKENEKLVKKQLSQALDATQQITSGIADGLQKRSELQEQADQKDIDMHARMLEVQAQLAAEGKDNVLGETLAQTAKAEEKKLQDAKEAAKRQELLAEIQTFQKVLQAALNADKPFLQAFGEALAAEGVVSTAFSKLFSGFFDGTTNTGTTANPLDANGGRPAIIHDNERIVPKVLNDKIPDSMSNEELVNNALAYTNSSLKPTFFPKVSVQDNSVAAFNNRQIEAMTKEIKAVKDEIRNKPVQNTNFRGLTEWDEEIRSRNLTTIIHHKKSQSRPSLRVHG